MLNIPNLFIVGAPKCGTTSLHEYLKSLPDVYMSTFKEPQYFSETVMPITEFSKPIRDKSTYFSLFEKVQNQKIIGESSTSYLYDPKAPNLIYQLNPKAKIIIIIRDPVERTFSDWLHVHRPFYQNQQKFLKPSFYEQIQYSINEKIDYNKLHLRLYVGNYSKYIKKYQDIFGKENVLILIYEFFFKNVKKNMKEVCDFLEIKYDPSKFNNKIHNTYFGPKNSMAEFLLYNNTLKKLFKILLFNQNIKSRAKKSLLTSKNKPKMNESERKILVDYFYSDVKKLETILNKKLPWKNFNF
jgi:hypothetical protein